MSRFLKCRSRPIRLRPTKINEAPDILPRQRLITHSLERLLAGKAPGCQSAQKSGTDCADHGPSSHLASAGFSLIEMMVVVSLLAIMLAIAVPNFTQMVASDRVKTAANELYGLLQYARGEAVGRGQRVTISASTSDTWAETLDVIALKDGEPVTLRHYESLNQPEVSAITAAQSLSELAFYSNGSSSDSTLITLCYSSDSSIAGRTISVARSGQISAPESTSCE